MGSDALLALIGVIIGTIGVKLWDSVVEWSKGRKDEAQKNADRLSKAQNEIHALRELLTATRQIALKNGATYDELPRLDKTKDH